MFEFSTDAVFWITLGAIAFLLVLSGFFSGSETALTAASRGKLRSQADKGSRGARRALDITEDNERLIGSILLGNNFVNILATSLATALLTKVFGQNGIALATLFMTLMVLIFAEVLPKTYAILNAERMASAVSRPVSVVVRVFAPFVSAVRAVVRGVLRLFGAQVNPDSNIMAVHDEIAGALSLGHEEGIVEKEDRDRILGALDLSERTVEEIMLHRSGIEMLDASLPAELVFAQALASEHTRLPLFEGEPENIIGVVHARDILRAVGNWDNIQRAKNPKDDKPLFERFDIRNVAMKPYFVPETTTLDDQMREFLRRHTHFALVVDEYGALQGLITLEDILEEIVGEISDEFDRQDETTGLQPDADGHVVIDGATTIRDLNRACDWSLPDEDANTVAGLVIYEAQTIPTEGQVFSFHGFRFEVLERKANRLTKIRLRPL